MPGTGERLNRLRVERPSGQVHAAAYTAKVRVSVRAGDIIIVREGSGTGEGKSFNPGASTRACA